MRNSTISSDHGPAPMCADPSPHMGTQPPHSTLTRKARHSNKNQPPHPAEAPVSHVQHQRQPHPKHAPTAPHTEIGPVPHRDRSNSARPTQRRSTHDKLEGENHMPHLGNRRQTAHPRKHDRSRHGLRPISSRSKTDLDASFDRSRAGTGPISAKGGRMGERVRARPGPSASVEGDERKPRLRLPSPCSPVRPGRCGRPPPPARAWGARRCRGRTARRPAGR